MRYYIGNLPYSVNKRQIIDTFAEHGCAVTNIDLVLDKVTSRFRGYAFADMDEIPTGEVLFGIRRVHIRPSGR